MMRDRSLFVVAVVVLILAALACRSCDTIDSSKLDPSEIYQEYSILASDKTTVDAEFRVSGATGTTIALVAPSGIEHNGKPMNEHLRTVLSGTYYSAETSGFTGSHTFIFTDSSGKQYTNRVEFEPIKIAVDSLDLNKSAGSIRIPLSRGLVDGESVTVRITSDVEPPKPSANIANSNANISAGPDFSTDVSGVVDSDTKTLRIDMEALRNFAVGKAKMYITLNSSRKPAEMGIRGGNISYVIQSPSIPVRVFDQQ